MPYRRLFSPDDSSVTAATQGRSLGDERQSPIYVYSKDIILAVNVALATNRPLLVRGPSGTGKSSLARSVASHLNWRYFEAVVTSRTQARDLLWEVDLVRRLRDAQGGRENVSQDLSEYIIPGILWQAFDPHSAHSYGRKGGSAGMEATKYDTRHNARAVVLIDEIDKADPDMPNNLLVPLGSMQFEVEDIGLVVRSSPAKAPLVIITTNEERELSKPFLRRCVEMILPVPDKAGLLRIASAHFPHIPENEIAMAIDLTAQIANLFEPEDAGSPDVGTLTPATLIDILRACQELGLRPGGETWLHIVKLVLGVRSQAIA